MSSSSAAAEGAKQWLLERAASSIGSLPVTAKEIYGGGFFDNVCMPNLSVSLCSGGRVFCSFRIPPHLADTEGNWQPGAIATLIDDVGAAAIHTIVEHIKISVDFSISFFTSANINEEVEIEARTIEHKGNGKLTAMTVEVRKKENGSLVALGRQWMASSLPHPRSSL